MPNFYINNVPKLKESTIKLSNIDPSKTAPGFKSCSQKLYESNKKFK